MFDGATMGGIREAVAAYAAHFYPGLFSPADAQKIVDDAIAAENMLATVKALAAKRVADSELWRRDGDLSPAHHLARKAGTSVTKAREALDTAGKLAELPEVDRAARRGELSPSQAAPIADAATKDPKSESRLVKKAKGSSLGELLDDCARTKAAAEPNPDSRHRAIHSSRYLRAALPIDRRRGGRDLLHRAADWDALVRGWPSEGEMSEIAGVGPVPVSVVRAMLASGDAFLAAVVTKGVDVVNVAHLGRRPSAFQQSALDWLSPGCSAVGCNMTVRLENDHRVDWATSKITLLGLLDPLCKHHHHLKTHKGWAFVEGAGKRLMVPPRDPRHHRHGKARPPNEGVA